MPQSPSISKPLDALIRQIDAAKKRWDSLHPLDPSLARTIQEKLRAAWTHHSNALEGNTLTLGETIFFLREGLTSEGKPLKDYLEAKNHAEAIDYLKEAVTQARPISEGLIKELNALLLKGIESTPAKTESGQPVQKKVHAGEYKKEPNHVLTISGKIHRYIDPVHVPAEMEALLNRYRDDEKKKIHPLILASDLHYGLVRIHPFDDCNGRVARLLMNLVLLQKGYPPSVIPKEKRKAYLTSLEKADAGDQVPFYEIVGQGLMTTFETYFEAAAS